MAGCSTGIIKRRRQEFVITTVTLMVVLTQALMVTSLYIPNGPMSYSNSPMRRADSDEEDEMDGRASSPYQNQDENSSPANDGFDDNEQEGSYDETPKDEEGQADLERFFDDHLGASERDGMDKENLPTNLTPFFIRVPDSQARFGGFSDAVVQQNGAHLAGQLVGASQPASAYDRLASQPTMSYVEQSPLMSPNNVETSYIKLPDKRLIITRQITRGPIYKGGLDDDLPPIPSHILQLQGRSFNLDQEKDAKQQQAEQQKQASARSDDELNAKGSAIVKTEDDDMDPVYVTTMTDKPFKIDALGGFDPEEDFQDATRELDEPAKKSGNRKRSSEEYQQIKDISFNDPEVDTLFNDASETDEVIFDQDPYQTDLEAEMSGRSAIERPEDGADEAAAADEVEDNSARKKVAPKSNSDDDSESDWVNDGVDDMDVPSQSYQDAVLEKAALNEAARRAAEEPNEDEARQQEQEQQEQPPQSEADQGDGESQRMPNADYLKNDLGGVDDIDEPVR